MNSVTRDILLCTIYSGLLALLSLFAFEHYTCGAATLSRVWHEDLKSLSASGTLPAELNDLREIEWITPDERARVWSRFAHHPFDLRPTGQYKLEVLVVSDSSPLTAVIQHHLIQVSTGNSVWELARTYLLKSK